MFDDKVNTYTSTGSKLVYHGNAIKRIVDHRLGTPISLQIAPTSRCNLNCIFCSNVLWCSITGKKGNVSSRHLPTHIFGRSMRRRGRTSQAALCRWAIHAIRCRSTISASTWEKRLLGVVASTWVAVGMNFFHLTQKPWMLHQNS